MHVILTGATGLVGSACLNQLLSAQTITKISILSRRPVAMAEGQAKVNVIIHKDFDQYDDKIIEQLKGADGCVWALGISVNDVTKEQYRKITIDYPIAAAKAFAPLADPFKFVYVSGEGATTTPGMLTARFGRVKGDAESQLLALSKTSLPSLKPYSVRPGFVDAKFDPDIQAHLPQRSGLSKAGQNVLGPIIRSTYSAMVSPTRDLGRVITELVTSNGEPLEGPGVSGEGRTVSNVALRRLAGI